MTVFRRAVAALSLVLMAVVLSACVQNPPCDQVGYVQPCQVPGEPQNVTFDETATFVVIGAVIVIAAFSAIREM